MNGYWSAKRLLPSDLPPVSEQTLREYGKQATADWMHCPRFYTKDNRRDTNQSDVRKPGDIERLVHRIADNESRRTEKQYCVSQSIGKATPTFRAAWRPTLQAH